MGLTQRNIRHIFSFHNSNRTNFILAGVCIILSIFAIKCYLDNHKNDFDQPPYKNWHLRTPKLYTQNALYDWYAQPKVEPNEPPRPGELGKGFTLPTKYHDVMNERFMEHNFNIMVSDRIPIIRSLPDMRETACLDVKIPSKLPDTSIIIIFHNEAWSTLVRTLWSIIKRSPHDLVREIILVDDSSEMDHLGARLEEYVRTMPIEVIILRQLPRQGLIQARLMGAAIARGQILTFIDAHCECTEGWLEPLLARIAENRYIVPSPTIDIIDYDSFEYKKASFVQYGAFSTTFVFKWIPVSKREFARVKSNVTSPLRQPVMAGGLFSIDRQFFYEIGSYDEDMQIWGGENLEISFRIWMCGGILEVLPCSHVGHVFRKSTPYTFPKGVHYTVTYNIVRAIKVWANEYEPIFYKLNAGSTQKYDYGDISSRVAIRQRLECKSFRWYLENIFPEHTLPDHNEFIGDIRNLELNECLDTMYNKNILELNACHQLSGLQTWIMDNNGSIRNDDMCIDAPIQNGDVVMHKCHNEGGAQLWKYNEQEQTLMLASTKQCMSKPAVNMTVPRMQTCDGSLGQKWVLSIND